jgi:5-enolpyruvylshikimate-3-phosphate synthase
MACSPCVAAERARSASNLRDMEAAREAETEDFAAIDQEIMDMGAEFDLDDDALLNMLSRIITA